MSKVFNPEPNHITIITYMHPINLHNDHTTTVHCESLFVINAGMAALPVLCDNGVPTGNTVLPTTTGGVISGTIKNVPEIKVQNICL